MQTLNAYYKELFDQEIKGSRWYQSIPEIHKKSMKIKMIGVQMRPYSGMMEKRDRPALVAEAECAGETRTFALALDSSNYVQMVD